jgi:hypothetical protein
MILLLLTENDMLCGFGALSDPNSQSVYKGEFRGKVCVTNDRHGDVNNVLPVRHCRRHEARRGGLHLSNRGIQRYLRDLHTSSNHYNWFHHELQVFSRETRGMVWG